MTSDPGPFESDRPWTDPITSALRELATEIAPLSGGQVADYIPELSKADPSLFGLALVSRDGYVYATGDAEVPFTVQSISKPFVLALALSDLGWEGVAARVGTEPSGEAFNAISLEEGTGRPANPMVNAGAIVTTSAVLAASPEERFERIRRCLSEFAGHELAVDEAAFASERHTGDRNRALAYLMRNAGSLAGEVDDVLDVYFRQCSLLVDTTDLAVMAATLANGGTNPVSGRVIVDRAVCAGVLTIMATCGMYDYSGEWLLKVGLPAKSGVSGGLVAASPGQFGIGMFSPRIDELGNSVRAVAASEAISERFGLHLLRVPNRPAHPIYLSTTAAWQRSTRPRPEADVATLDRTGDRIAIKGLQGDIEFLEAESVVRALADLPAERTSRWLVLDLHRVTRLQPVAANILRALVFELADHGVVLALADDENRVTVDAAAVPFSSLDEALAWCEDALLAEQDALAEAGGDAHT